MAVFRRNSFRLTDTHGLIKLMARCNKTFLRSFFASRLPPLGLPVPDRNAGAGAACHHVFLSELGWWIVQSTQRGDFPQTKV
jgi:hypothetical protein